MKSIVAAAGIIAACYGAFIFALWRARDSDISRFVVAGGPGVDAREVPPGLTVRKDIGGYDGMAFYRLALNPFTHQKKEFGIALDGPPYRQQRIGYPLLVFVATFGQARWVPAMLVVINWLALVAMAAFGAAFARHLGFSGLWGVVFPLYPGFILTLSRDTSEIVVCAFVVAAAYALVRERWIAASLCIAYAALTRETAMMLVIGLVIVYLWRRAIPPVTFIVPSIIFAIWQLVLTAIWGRVPVRSGGHDVAVPFSEYAKFFAEAAPRRLSLQRLNFMECVYLALLVIIVVLAWRRSQAGHEWRIAWLGHLAIFAVMPHSIWIEDFGFLRIFADVFLASAVLIVASKATARWLTLIPTVVLWVHLARHVVALK